MDSKGNLFYQKGDLFVNASTKEALTQLEAEQRKLLEIPSEDTQKVVGMNRAERRAYYRRFKKHPPK